MSTIRQVILAEKMLENIRLATPKPAGVILVEAGYSPTIAKTPSRILQSEGYKAALEELIPENLVKQRHQELLNAGVIGHFEFRGETTYIDIDENNEPQELDEPEVKEGLEAQPHGGALKRSKTSEKVTKIATDDEIKSIIESVPGCRLIYIKNLHSTLKVAYFQQPDNRSRKDAIDMAYKIKGSYAPEKSLNLNVNTNAMPSSELQDLANILNEQIRNNNSGTNKPSNGNEAHIVGQEVQS